MELTEKDVARLTRNEHSYLVSRKKPRKRRPVLLLHGAGGGAWYWRKMLKFFAAAGGYPVYAPDLPGHGERFGEDITEMGVVAYAVYIARFIEEVVLPAHGDLLPFIVGHSMGGLIAQKLAEMGLTYKVILLAPAAPKGIKLKFREDFVVPWIDRAKGALSLVTQRLITPSDKLLRTLFINPDESADMIALCKKHGVYESRTAILDLVRSRVPIDRKKVTIPMLIIGFTQDHIIAERVVRLIGTYYGATEVKGTKGLRRELEIRPDLGHLCPLEYGWERVAQRCLAWME